MNKDTVLITGGAGYIGSHIAKHFLELGFKVIILDNLSRGYKEAIDALNSFGDLEFVNGDINSLEILDRIFSSYSISLVIHCAALCYPDESIAKPLEYYQVNTLGTVNLLNAMARASVDKIIFSSTCAVYGEVKQLPVQETHELKPITPYGLSKSFAEQAIAMAADTNKIKYIIFRFFNVCGADASGVIGDSKKPSQLLMQNAVRGALNIAPFSYTCSVVKTPDQTPIRDYIDVTDLARAHEAAFNYLKDNKDSAILNLGNGQGYSVKQIIDTVEKALNVSIEKGQGAPRLGETPQIYADISRVKLALNWQPIKSLKDSIEGLVEWYKGHPNGYNN